ncbi:methyltransferase domain-containing protein [Anoxybacterium hadale]|uniref:Methyltransferase domain-containing protein n=1 Tax=Anoxybacterium hadale TaxID=3408580 RepID=A0ACD1ADC3_9FIRM|nr:methyltransferase domain-containing protein [Clostridiales bacterium]
MNLITKPTALSLKIIEEYIKPGDIVVDATAGNGHDTLALAKLAGTGGKVYAFDVQPLALEQTKTLLEKEGYFHNCTLVLDSHENMGSHIPDHEKKELSAVVFNLGYLPGGQKEMTTQAGATIAAVEQALYLIRIGGIIAVTMYPGHPEGEMERASLLHFSENLSQRQYHTAYLSFPNQKKSPPELLLITRKC